MVQRSRPHRRDASPIVALWRDHARGFREIPLEPGAHGVVLTVCMDRATRRSADGRWPVDNGTRVFDVAVHQVGASTAGSMAPPSHSTAPIRHLLDANELTVLTAWAEAVAEAVAHAPECAATILADARSGGAMARDARSRGAPGRPRRGDQLHGPRCSRRVTTRRGDDVDDNLGAARGPAGRNGSRRASPPRAPCNDRTACHATDQVSPAPLVSCASVLLCQGESRAGCVTT
jgi:hypothetical protein